MQSDRLQPAIYQQSWLTGLPLTPPSPALGKTQASGVYTLTDPASPTTLLTKQQRRAAFTSSYDEEKAAMRMALEWLSLSHTAAAICTDSQSLLKAIQRGSTDTTDLRR